MLCSYRECLERIQKLGGGVGDQVRTGLKCAYQTLTKTIKSFANS